jgi:glycosyltransferase involved in cell wall biosynthesis
MKICLVAPVSRWRGGIHQYSVHLANHLAGKAHVEVISYRSIFPRWLYPGKAQISAGEVAVSAGVAIHEILKYHSLASSFKAARLIHERIEPDVVDIQWFVPQHGFVLIPLMIFLKFWFRSRAKICLTVHNVLPHEKRLFDRLFSRYAFRFSDRLLVHAERLRDQAVHEFRESSRKIAVIPHGICADGHVAYGKNAARARLGIKEPYVVLFFGYVRPYKGLSDLIAAFKIVAERFDAALVIAGEFFSEVAPYRQELQRQGVLERTYLFARYIDSGEVPIFFSAADLLVQPYIKFSGQSGVTQTAYLHALPVLATAVGGLPELVIDGQTGVIVEPKQPQALALAMEALLGDDEKRRQYGLNGKRHLEGNLTWDRVAEKRLEVYGHC